MVVLHPQEARQLLAAVDLRHPFGPRDRAMLVLALHTGLRVSELIGLNHEHVVLNGSPRSTLHLPASLGKGKRSRCLPLNAAAQNAVATILNFNVSRGFSVAPTAPLLVTRKHTRLNVRTVQRLVETLRESAGLDVHATPHSLRHTFATAIAQKTGNLRAVQMLLGHQRLETAQIYTHPSRAELEQAVGTLVRRPQG